MGSTHFKQTERGWQKIFLSFYWEFPQFLAEANRKQANLDSGDTTFQLWKAVGDELIFEVEVRDEKAVSRAVRVWLSAVAEYEQQVLADRKLALKGGAFIGTFPGPDSESTIPRNPSEEGSDAPVVLLNRDALSGTRAPSKYLYDYFGPSIDTGFRIIGRAERRYFTLSVEVAWAMGLAAHDAGASDANERTHVVKDFVFLGAHILKGVWRAREYPVFAIDRDYEDPVNEAIAKLSGAALDASLVIGVCRACGSDPSWPSTLYLPDSHHEAFTTPPVDAMEGLFESEQTLDGAETPAPPSDGVEESEEGPLG